MRRGAILLALSIIAASGSAGGSPQDVKTLHRFQGDDGMFPATPLIRDGQGNFYGTTSRGGAQDLGTIFKLSRRKLTVLYSFTGGADGSLPDGRLAMDASGNLYGMAHSGGVQSAGTVYKYTPSGSFEVLRAFNNRKRRGEGPSGGLVMDAAGNLYGMTEFGGDFDWGMVFRLAPDKKFTILHSFDNRTEGVAPSGPLLLDSGGNLYGTLAQLGLHNGGALFKLAPAGDGSYVWTLLHAFCTFQSGCTDGQGLDGVIADASGNLYGTTGNGGLYDRGSIYKLTPGGTFSVLHSFGRSADDGNPDGARPQGPLVMDPEGNFYGVTTGKARGRCCGTIFRLDADGTQHILHYFHFLGSGGRTPRAGLFRDEAGFLYGTTVDGGSDDHRSDYGVIFRYPR